MEFSLSEETIVRKARARKWVDEVLDPLSTPLEEEERLPDELVAELRRGEFFGLTIPKEYGGQGWTVVEWFSVLEELSRAYATVRLVAHTMNGLFWRPLQVFGTEEQRQKYLPKLASGEIWSANSLTEPEGGTGRDINAKAVLDGGDYVLNGHKWLITLF
ncbi:MAG: acyl-CoA/acyl-ACP dehydrogenase, partial [Thermoleophilia bacterium]|nr:acyl-CoA/acyl-ACP dehydrogenase [Thermoleophilia bacterium]